MNHEQPSNNIGTQKETNSYRSSANTMLVGSEIPDLGADEPPNLEPDAILNETNFSYIFNVKTMTYLLLIVRGMTTFTDLANFDYQSETLKISSSKMQVLEGVFSCACVIKFLFAFLFDKILSKVRKTKYILVVTSTGRTLSLLSIYYFRPNLYWYIFIMIFESVCSVMEDILTYHVLSILSQEDCKTQKGNHLAYISVFSSIGEVLGIYLGGRFLFSFGADKNYLFGSILPFSAVLFALLTTEKEHKIVQQNGLWKDLVSFKQILKNKAMVLLLTLNFIVNLQPGWETYNDYYFKAQHRFNNNDLGELHALRTIFTILGSFFFAKVYTHISIKLMHVSTLIITVYCHIMFLLVTKGITLKRGLSTKFCVILYDDIVYFVSAGGNISVFMAWCALMPNNMKNSYMAIFTGLTGLGNNISSYIGAGLTKLLELARNNYEHFNYTIYIKIFYLTVLVFCILLLPLPPVFLELSKDVKGDDPSLVNPTKPDRLNNDMGLEVIFASLNYQLTSSL